MLDAKIASASKKIITNPFFKKKVSLEEQQAQMDDRFSVDDRLRTRSTNTFGSLGAHEAVLAHTDLLSITLHGDDIQDFDTRWDQAQVSTNEMPKDRILESLYKMRTRESVQLKTVLARYAQEIHQNLSKPSYQKLKTMVKRDV